MPSRYLQWENGKQIIAKASKTITECRHHLEIDIPNHSALSLGTMFSVSGAALFIRSIELNTKNSLIFSLGTVNVFRVGLAFGKFR